MNKLITEREWQQSVAEAFGHAVKSAYQDLIDKAVAEEREACAKACEHQPHWVSCAAAIRARGNHGKA